MIFSGGFGVCALGLFSLASVGSFTPTAILSLFAVFLIAHLLRERKEVFSANLFSYLRTVIVLGVIVLGFGTVVQPYEVLEGFPDAPTYLGASYHLARTGKFTHQDPLVLDMTPTERRVFFRNRVTGDTTGPFARFGGGVPLTDVDRGIVKFAFPSLFPCWLAIGIQFLGEVGFKPIMSLLGTLSLTYLYFLGQELGGRRLGIALVAVTASFYPQIYYACMPLPEILSQTSFLAGAFVLMHGQANQRALPVGQQRLAGILWGCAFLAREEALFFISLSLVLAFCVVPSLRRNISRWQTLIRWLTCFAILACYHFLDQVIDQDLDMPWSVPVLPTFFHSHVFPCTRWLFAHPPSNLMAFVSLGATALWFQRWLMKPQPAIIRTARTVSGLALLSYILIRAVSERSAMLQPSSFFWFPLYTSPWMTGFLFAGIALLIVLSIRHTASPQLWMLCILFSFTTLHRVIFPWIQGAQPWCIRRFVSMIFPLWFLLSLAGWFLGVARSQLRLRRGLAAILTLMMLLITGSFARKSSYLFQNPPYQHVFSQMHELASEIPLNALVLTSNGSFPTVLHYAANRETVVFPFRPSLGDFATSYIQRQLNNGRNVVVILRDDVPFPSSMRDGLSLDRFSQRTITFTLVPARPADQFPAQSKNVALNFVLYRLQIGEGATNG